MITHNYKTFRDLRFGHFYPVFTCPVIGYYLMASPSLLYLESSDVLTYFGQQMTTNSLYSVLYRRSFLCVVLLFTFVYKHGDIHNYMHSARRPRGQRATLGTKYICALPCSSRCTAGCTCKCVIYMCTGINYDFVCTGLHTNQEIK